MAARARRSGMAARAPGRLGAVSSLRGRRRWTSSARTIGLVVGVVLAACSDGGGNDATNAAPAGPPVVIGLINQENAPVGSFPEVQGAARAAVDHVNRDLGGVGGRPLRLEVCTTVGTPESSQTCATELVAKRPVAVLGGVDLGAAAALAILARAKIPYVGGAPTLGDELTAKGAFLLTGGSAADLLGGVSYALKTLRAKRVGALYVDLPGVLSTVVAAAPIVLRSRGVTEVKLVAEKADTADFTPALKALAASDPDVIFVVFGAQSCARIMAARRSLGITAATFYPGACASEAVVQAGGDGAEGAYFGTGYLPFEDRSPQVATWRRAVDDTSSLSQAGFAAVMNLHALLAEIDGEPTPAGVTTRLEAARDHPGYMAHPYTCDSRQVRFLTAVCNPNVRVVRFEGGRFHDVGGGWVSGAELLDLGG